MTVKWYPQRRAISVYSTLFVVFLHHRLFVVGVISKFSMEEIKRLRSSRRGFRAHLSKIVTAIQRIVERDPSLPLSDLDISLLSDFREQLKRKKDILVDLDTKIADLIEEETS